MLFYRRIAQLQGCGFVGSSTMDRKSRRILRRQPVLLFVGGSALVQKAPSAIILAPLRLAPGETPQDHAAGQRKHEPAVYHS